MDETTKIIQDYYDSEVQEEWNRIVGRPEFLLTCRMLNRYIQNGDTVLDIGGGPGRYSIYLSEKGCRVTLLDLSAENTKFAAAKAMEQNVLLQTVTGDAREADNLTQGLFDHVLLMGPMYHLLEENSRTDAVKAALNCLKPGGTLFVSFINMTAGIIYGMKIAPEMIASTLPDDITYLNHFITQKSFAGDAFTKAFFISQQEILPFMSKFPLEKLHLFGQEGITSPCEHNLMSQPAEIVDLWLDFCERIWEREDLLSWSEHLMYVGRKVQSV